MSAGGLPLPFVLPASLVCSPFCARGCCALTHPRSSGRGRFTPGALAPVNVINNGYTAVRVDYLYSRDFLVVGDKRYELTQFHFHHPREEYLHGRQYDMVLHLMHKGSDGEVARIAILLKAGSANSTIEQL
jgi:carbonic anhydrase